MTFVAHPNTPSIASEIVNPILNSEREASLPHADKLTRPATVPVVFSGTVVLPVVVTRYRLERVEGASIGSESMYLLLKDMSYESALAVAMAQQAAVMAEWERLQPPGWRAQAAKDVE